MLWFPEKKRLCSFRSSLIGVFSDVLEKNHKIGDEIGMDHIWKTEICVVLADSYYEFSFYFDLTYFF
jgi:hypothetical protein